MDKLNIYSLFTCGYLSDITPQNSSVRYFINVMHYVQFLVLNPIDMDEVRMICDILAILWQYCTNI